MLRPGALLEISFFHTPAVLLLLYNIIFLTWEDEYSQDRFPAIHLFSIANMMLSVLQNLNKAPALMNQFFHTHCNE
jgi:hypothetical protein